MYRMHCTTSGSYDVLTTVGLLDPENRLLADAIGSRRALLVTVPPVEALYGAALRAYLDELPAPIAIDVVDMSEQTKTMATVLEVCAAAQRHGLGRRDLLIAFGGGVCCDVVSVAASLIRRGIPYLCLPTTLVGQIDAGIALKGGVNFRGAKNYLGCFAPPSGVLVDPSLLLTVPPVELRAGLAEVLKVAMVLDAALFDLLGEVGPQLARTGFLAPTGAGREVVERAITLMLDELSLNCYEDRGLERLVDFGHTFSGHLEELSDYRLRHGEAVAVDIAVTCALGVELGLLPAGDLAAVLSVLSDLGLPAHSPLCTPAHLVDAMRSTAAHRDGDLNLVVPTGIGAATFVRHIDDVPLAALEAALRRLSTPAGRWRLPAAAGTSRSAAGHPTATSTTTSRSGAEPVLSRPWVPPGRLTTTSPGPTPKVSPSTCMVPRPSTIT
jgi:3-dehydroquinate synthetase